MEKSQFNSLVDKGFNHIPLSREVLVDTDTPLALYLKLANNPYSYFLESVQGGEKWGRYSFVGLAAETVIKVMITMFQSKKMENYISNIK